MKTTPVCPMHDPWDRDPRCLNCEAELKAIGAGAHAGAHNLFLDLSDLQEETLRALQAILELDRGTQIMGTVNYARVNDAIGTIAFHRAWRERHRTPEALTVPELLSHDELELHAQTRALGRPYTLEDLPLPEIDTDRDDGDQDSINHQLSYTRHVEGN